MASSSSSSNRSWKYDVFLSFRGEDTRKTFVDHLYSALDHHNIHTYKDDVTLPRGDTIGPSLMKAIEESQIVIVMFSENYADSSWCLDELEHIMKCRHERGQIVLPVFYNVDPSHVRKQKRKYEEAFSKHTSASDNKLESWRKALADASSIAGWEPKLVANGHEAKCIQEIVSSVLDKLSSLDSVVDDEKLVGMGTRLRDLKSQLEIGSSGVRTVGIWGIGGGGKTTLATSLFMEISANFNGCCFLENVREESSQHGLKSLQQKILSTIFDKKIEVQSVDIGKYTIKHMLCRRNVLIVLDDVDDLEQLEALAGCHNWFGDGSRIIITTRDEHLLITHRVDKVYPVSLLSHDEASWLFKRHAYCENNPVEDYDKLSFRVISYVHGLPLAIKILGSFLYDKDENEWISALDKLREIPNRKVTDILKISYDGLEHDEKELFLEIACFRREYEYGAMEKLDACGFHPRIGIKVLRQKALITIASDGQIDMHDLVQEMGRHIVRGEHPNNPEKHSRVWRDEDIEDMCAGNATTVKENHKIEAIRYYLFNKRPAKGFMTLVSNLKKLRCLFVYPPFNIGYECDEGPSFLSNELKYIEWFNYPASLFPESFQPRKLVVLDIYHTLQKELWKGYKYMPCLKELELNNAKALVRTPDIGGLSCLQNLIIKQCESLEEIHQSLGNHTSLVKVHVSSCNKLASFPTIVRMEKLEILKISDCKALLEIPLIKANLHFNKVSVRHCLPCLKELKLKGVDALSLWSCKLKDGDIPREIGELSSLKELHLGGNHFSRVDISLSKLTQLKLLTLDGCKMLVELPELPPNLAILKAEDCDSLEAIGDGIYSNCKWLSLVSVKSYEEGCCSFVGGKRLLESMLQGNAIENHQCMSLILKGLEIPKEFEPRLLRGSRYRLQLPENWFNEYTGFLFCSVFEVSVPPSIEITMGQGGGKMGMGDSQDEWVFWEEEEEDESFDDDIGVGMGLSEEDESFDDDIGVGMGLSKNTRMHTWVMYVSFGSLRSTVWWDQTSTAVDFSVAPICYRDEDESFVSGFGARLVSKKNQMKETTTTNSSSEFSVDGDYKCKFKIHHDSKSELKCRLQSYWY